MDISLLYAIIVGSVFVLFLLRHAHKFIIALFWSRRVFVFLYRHAYPALIRRNRALPPITRVYVLIQTIYWAGTVTCNTVGISGLAEGSSRAGLLALVNLVPLLFSDRLGFAADILSLSRRTYLQIHKAMGIMAVLQFTAHIVLETIRGSFVLSKEKDKYGLVAVVALGSTVLVALPLFRKYYYEVFLWLHYALSAVIVYALWRRFQALRMERTLLIIAISIHAGIMLWRLTRLIYRNTLSKSLWSKAHMIKIGDALEVSLSVPRPWKVKAGEYVYLCVPGLSPVSFLEWHPFSITRWSTNTAGKATEISLLIKPQHGLTSRLIRFTSPEEGFRVAIDGPYGQSIDTSQYGTLILLATGIGIAAQMPLIKQTLAEHNTGRTSVQRIHVVWQIEQECDEDWVADRINSMMHEEDQATRMLYSSLYVLNAYEKKDSQTEVEKQYGARVKKIYGPADLRCVLATEIQESIGRTLISVSTNASFRDQIRDLSRNLIADDVDFRELDFQPFEERRLWRASNV